MCCIGVFMYVCMYLCMYVCTMYVWDLGAQNACVEIREQLLVLSFQHVDPEAQTWVGQLSNKHLYPLSLLASPLKLFLRTHLCSFMGKPIEEWQ